MDITFKNKKILIAGAGSDFAQPLIPEFINDTNKVGLAVFTSADRLANYKNKANVKIFASDLSIPNNGILLVENFVEWAGGIDIFIQLTGNVSNPCSFESLNIDDWNNDLDVNLTTPFFMAQTALKYMKPYSKIILTGSASAGQHGGGLKTFAYGVGKCGIGRVVRGIAKYSGDKKILINCIAPGFINTRMHSKDGKSPSDIAKRVETVPLKCAGEVSDVTSLILYLVSDQNRYINGQTIIIDGGDFL